MYKYETVFIDEVCSICVNKNNDQDLCNITQKINGEFDCCNKKIKQSPMKEGVNI